MKDRDYLLKVKKLPCVICGTSPCDAHHAKGLEHDTGTGLKASDHDTIPLCRKHHLTGKDAFHNMGSKAWEAKYGTQAEHIKRTKAKIALVDSFKW